MTMGLVLLYALGVEKFTLRGRRKNLSALLGGQGRMMSKESATRW